MSNDEAWTAHQLKLGFTGKAAKPLPVSTSKELTEVLQEFLFLAGMEIAAHAAHAQENKDDG